MFCKKCGKQISDDSLFCSFCGENVSQIINSNSSNEPRGTLINNAIYAQEQNAFRRSELKNVRPFRIASLIVSTIVLLFLFAEWVKISLPMMGTYNYSTFKLFNAISHLEDMGVINDMLWLPVVLIVLNCLGILFTIIYVIKEWKSEPCEKGNDTISLGYGVMNLILVIFGVCLIGFFIISFVLDPVKISVSSNLFFVGIFAAINRFFILTKYNDLNYYNSQTLSVEWEEAEKEQNKIEKIKYDEDILANGGWRCETCGKVNPHYTGTCSCGTRKNNLL